MLRYANWIEISFQYSLSVCQSAVSELIFKMSPFSTHNIDSEKIDKLRFGKCMLEGTRVSVT